ncbi:MAG: hypothetical protein J2P17_19750 [Mycobacterium sp.]|nr:hypothetical protein [Mycobacterium sp.]
MRGHAMDLAEIDAQTACLLPMRETLCTFGCTNIVTVVGINLAIAINAASINSSATAFAFQQIGAWQH